MCFAQGEGEKADEIASGRSAMFNKELAAQVDERLRAVLAMPQLAVSKLCFWGVLPFSS